MSMDMISAPDWVDLVGARDPTYAKGHFGEVVEATSLENIDDYDIVLMGEPYDGATIFGAMSTYGRPGSRDGPEGVRKALANTKTYSLATGAIEQSIGDVGDIDYTIMMETPEEAHKLIQDVAQTLHESQAFPIFIGGDHSLAAPNAMPLLDKYDSVGIINLDSHDDLLEFVRGHPHHGTAFEQLHQAGLDQYTLLGCRAFGLHEEDYIFKIGGEAISAEAVGDDPVKAAEDALDTMDGVDAIYVSLDMDVLDAIFSPAANAPYPGGIIPRELFRIMRTLAGDDRVVGFEVVEVSLSDQEGKIAPTSLNGGRAMAHFISGL